jgi:hypothetical protein
MFAKSPHDVTPRTRPGIGVKKAMSTVFFTNRKLLIADDLPKGQKYKQEYFVWDILPGLEREKMRYKRRKQGGTFYVHMDHSEAMMVRKSRANLTSKASYALRIHLILLT